MSSSLPSCMLTSQWKSMDALPKNVNRKIDRRLVRELFSAEVVAPERP
jgi:acyl-coenzyme A synthetase/AMP-(fatty) acid ligase